MDSRIPALRRGQRPGLSEHHVFRDCAEEYREANDRDPSHEQQYRDDGANHGEHSCVATTTGMPRRHPVCSLSARSLCQFRARISTMLRLEPEEEH